MDGVRPAQDVVVVGAGNAARCAALAAREEGASVTILEWAPEEEAGGNTRFTAGAIRFAYRGIDDLRELMPDLTDKEVEGADFGTYTEDQFFDDMGRVTDYRTDPDLCEILIRRSLETMQWMRKKGIRFAPIWGRQAFKIDGKFKFWGGLVVEAWGGGPGLVSALDEACQRSDVETLYNTRAVSLIVNDGRVEGLRVRRGGVESVLLARTVVLACGGFESNTEWRARYLGPGWDLAKVRGSRFNMGDGLRMALEAAAIPYGNWTGCHAVGWERNAPEFGDLAVGDSFQKHSYPFGIMINATGRRFLDEGADFRNYTYAKYGRVILSQPGGFAWQIFDAKVSHLLRDEYRIKQVTKVTANSLEDLVARLEDVDAPQALETIRSYNEAVRNDIPFNPNVKDGRRTVGIDPPKSHWANTLDTPPFEAYAVTCGITFTFGGLKISRKGEVLDLAQVPIPGLYAAGELVGGLFYNNYPGGTGLMSGSVFGRLAGSSAGSAAVANRQAEPEAAATG